jgi:hypothetical protein
MRKEAFYIIFTVTVLLAGCGDGKGRGRISGISVADTGQAVISFTEYEHNFGKVNEGEKVAYIFTFTNTGTSGLVINSAVASCGCTVPKYSGKPVAPGKNGQIEVRFDTEGRNGIQTKTITVRSNAKTPVVILKIVTEVINSNNK